MKILMRAVMDIADDFLLNAKRWEHHVEHLFDLDSYPEIKSVSNVTVTKTVEPIIIEREDWSIEEFAAFCKLFGLPESTDCIKLLDYVIESHSLNNENSTKLLESFNFK